MEPIIEPSPELKRQDRLDRMYTTIKNLILLIIGIAIIATFVEIYGINAKIDDEVQQIQASQKKNRSINDAQNSVILGYLVCIGTIKPEDRTKAIIDACVAKASATDITNY